MKATLALQKAIQDFSRVCLCGFLDCMEFYCLVSSISFFILSKMFCRFFFVPLLFASFTSHPPVLFGISAFALAWTVVTLSTVVIKTSLVPSLDCRCFLEESLRHQSFLYEVKNGLAVLHNEGEVVNWLIPNERDTFIAERKRLAGN